MPGGRGGGGFRPSRKDYTLLNATVGKDETDDIELGNKKSASVWRLLALAKDEIWVILLATVALLVGSLATVALPHLIGEMQDIAVQVIKGGEEEQAMRKLNDLLYEVGGVLVVGGVASGIRGWMFEAAASRVMCSLRERLFSALVQQEIGFFDRVRIGELMNRLSEDTRLMKAAGTISISILLRSSVTAVFGLVMMFITSWFLSLLTLALLPPLFLGFFLYARLNRHYTAKQLEASAAAATVSEECFGCIRTVRSFAQEKEACHRYDSAIEETLRWSIYMARIYGIFNCFGFTFAVGVMILILWYGARLVVQGHMTGGDLSEFVLYVVFVGTNAGALAATFSQLIQAVGAGERVFQLLDRHSQMSWQGNSQPKGSTQGGELAFEDVWFAYPSRPSTWVLQSFSLNIGAGKRVALVGPSGGGKSTVVNLIERFYDPQRGVVRLDGTPLPLIEHTFLHRQVSIVSQEPVLFAATILYNIAFGLPGGADSVNLEQVEAAARLANAHDFITAFPDGYNTMVGERGVRLSGGQKQRVAIARALLTDPRVLLLDEATSALDAESEALVQEALERVSSGRTVVVIAHRLSTVTSADEVVVLQEGQVVEKGTHEQLLAAGGAYSRLVRRQLLGGAVVESTDNLAQMDASDGTVPNV